MSSLGPTISCSDMDSMSDVPVSIKIEELSPNTMYTVYSYARPAKESLFECVVTYEADENGFIDLETSPALGGNYTGVEPMGVFWSMKGSPNNKNSYARFAKLDVTTPLVVTLEVYKCEGDDIKQFHTMNNGLGRRKIASLAINRWYMAKGTKRILLTVKEHGIHGTLFIPPGEGPFPAVVTMFGSHPGTMEYKASLLASHGFASLALAYFGVPGTPQLFLSATGDWTLRLEYFENAINLLLKTEKVDESCGVGVMVLSFTGFIGLAMASFLPKVRCLICQNAIIHVAYIDLLYKDLILSGHSWEVTDGSSIADAANFGRKLCQTFENSFALVSPAPEDHQIEFSKRKDVAYMFIASLSDANTPSEHYTNRAHKLLHLAEHPNYEILRYPGAGHLLEPPYIIHNKMTSIKNIYSGESVFNWGGETLTHCKAQEHAWKKQLSFLRRNLGKRHHL